MKTLINTGLKQIRIKILTFKDRIIKLLVTSEMHGVRLTKTNTTYYKNNLSLQIAGDYSQLTLLRATCYEKAFLFTERNLSK